MFVLYGLLRMHEQQQLQHNTIVVPFSMIQLRVGSFPKLLL